MTRVCKTHGGLGLPAGVSRRVAAGCQRRATAVERSNAQRARWLQKLGRARADERTPIHAL